VLPDASQTIGVAANECLNPQSVRNRCTRSDGQLTEDVSRPATFGIAPGLRGEVIHMRPR
jgi:hypothetical protein